MSKHTSAVRVRRFRAIPVGHALRNAASYQEMPAAELQVVAPEPRAAMPPAHPRSSQPSARQHAASRVVASHLAHDARNWLTVLRVHCDLLEQSGAVAVSHRSWLTELSATIDRGQSLMDSLLAAVSPAAPPSAAEIRENEEIKAAGHPAEGHGGSDAPLPFLSVYPIAELERRMPMLRQMAGPSIAVEFVRSQAHATGQDPFRDLRATAQVALSELGFERILLNLVRNAIEAMPNGGRLRIAVELRTSRTEAHEISAVGSTDTGADGIARERASLRIRIEDSGPGIAPAFSEHIFESGFSTRRSLGLETETGAATPVDASQTFIRETRRSRRENRGLGLAIAQEIVATAGGSLRLESGFESGFESGLESPLEAHATDRLCGACFVLEFPLLRLAPTGDDPNAVPQPENGHTGRHDIGPRQETDNSFCVPVKRPSLRLAPSHPVPLPSPIERNPRTMLNKISMPVNHLPSPLPDRSGMLHLLVVDDETPIRTAAAEIARNRGFAVHTADSIPTARAALAAHMADIVLLDLKLPGGGGLELLDEIRTLYPETVVIVMTAYATVASAVEAMRSGASEYLTKPFTLDELGDVLERGAERRHFDLESRRLRERLRTPEGFGTLIGRSPEMERMYRILAKVANTTHPVLILGESGTGKEMVARTIHYNGPNASHPFIPVDCGSLVPTLIESELFGYVKGAFTGANRAKDGLLATAEGGTVFLDEIGELPLDLQSKLLRALQEKEIRPVGSTQRIPINVRILAATNRDLPLMVEQGRFRKDLYFRLNVVNVKLPPLRDRRADIPVLAAHFLDKLRRENNRNYTLSDDVLRVMNTYDWPGNVRELENMIERACALSSGPLLHLGDLPTQLQEHRMQTQRLTLAARSEPDRAFDTAPTDAGILTIAEMEKQAILNTIRQLNGDKLTAAKLLGIGKTTLYRKLKEYGIVDADIQ